MKKFVVSIEKVVTYDVPGTYKSTAELVQSMDPELLHVIEDDDA